MNHNEDGMDRSNIIGSAGLDPATFTMAIIAGSCRFMDLI
jgi:hypothetical protein